ncbi:MAG TPA: hypothetical protein VFB62_19230, partial [Polyangiaceae bacterium]|nr:hypothetical protein [Polyangiaceae bacterium]
MTCPIRFRNKLALAIPLLFGCAEIDPIAPDVCGNHVVEPHVHEECDAPTGCGAPQTPAACRFTCEGGAACPDGYRCGVDHVCRKPSGTFEVIGQSELDFNRDLVVRDADGDG